MAAFGHASRCCTRILCSNQVEFSRVIQTCGRTVKQTVPLSHGCQQQNGHLDFRIQVRHKSFWTQFIDNLKQEYSKSKDMKDSLKKFREEADKLEKSEALKKVREKYDAIESETSSRSAAVKKKLDEVKEKMRETLEDAEKSEYGQKSKEWMEEVVKSAGKAAETVSKGSEQIGKSQVFQTVSQSIKAVKKEIDDTAMARGRPYSPPKKLRKRTETLGKKQEEKEIEADTESIGVVLHKDSRWYQSWENFKDNNVYVHKLFDLKTKYEESDHLFIRATRTVTDKMTELFGGVFSRTEMSDVLTEIVKMDPSFDKEKFIKDCQYDIIPNILEAMIRGDLEVLKDWCHEAPFNAIAHPIKQALQMGYHLESQVLDVNNVDIAAGKMMEQGPVIIISFNSQQVMVVRDSRGKVVEGDPDKIMKVFYVWALCRDQTVLDPRAAWRLVDLSSSPQDQWL